MKDSYYQLKSLLDLLRLESGAEIVHQSHKNKISLVSLNNFRRMAERERMGESPPDGQVPEPTVDSYSVGITKLQHEFTNGGLKRFQPYCPGIKSMEIQHPRNDAEKEDGMGHEHQLDQSSDESHADEDDDDE
jgi:hypothetical protein